MLSKTKTKFIVAAAAFVVCGCFVVSALVFGVAFVNPAHAQVSIDFPSNFADFSSQDIKTTISNIVRIVLGFVGIVFLLLILFAGFLWMTSAGEQDKISRAKKIIAASVIGLLITLSSYAIARFVINSFVRGTSDGGSSSSGSTGGPGGFGYALGGGILESHYPARNAHNVPRNTNIFITFKEAINPNTLCDTGTNTVRIGSVQIVDIANGVVTDPNDTDPDDNTLDTIACTTSDNLTFKLDPNEFLGTSNANVQYRVTLTSNIKKAADNNPAFERDDYSWNFWVSTAADETPPTVEEVFPGDTDVVDRNAVVQINFSESVDPTTISGIAPPFDSIQLSDAGVPLAGSFISSNQYRTTEFYANEQCGVNSCGTPMYCLPGPKTIQGVVRGSGAQPVTDMAGNVLDGDSAGGAGGDYTWSFQTTDTMDFTPPVIVNRTPVDTASDVSVTNPLIVDFSERMSAATIKSEDIGLSKGATDDVGFWLSKEETDMDPGAGTVIGTRVRIHHDPFTPYLPYHPGAHSTLKDSYQNCFSPAQCTPLYGGQC